MARSAKRPSKKAPAPRPGAFQNGAVALGGFISNNPILVGGSTAFLVTLFYVSANALWYQPYPHSGAFFATRSIEHFPVPAAPEPETTINIERPAAAPAAVGDPAVKRVQGVLKDLGFYDGTVDGLTGPNTRSAVEAYQRKVGLNATGAINDTLMEQLGATAAVPKPASRPDPAASLVMKASVETGAQPQSTNDRIVRIQAGLKAFGNNDIKLDGVVGAQTKAAIREFQSLFGLPETGEPDEVVYTKMREIGLTN